MTQINMTQTIPASSLSSASWTFSPDLVQFQLFIQQAGAWVAVEHAGQWRVDWREDISAAHLRARLSREDGKPVGSANLRLTATMPLLNYGGVLVPDCGRHYINTTKALDIRQQVYSVTAANAGHPFFAVNDEAGNLLASVGLLNHPGEVVMRRLLPTIGKRKAMVGGDQVLQLAFEWTAHHENSEPLDVDVFVNKTASHWFHALREYTDLIRQREQINYPQNSAAWEPVWCTWTAFPSAEMSETRILENARLAKKMGAGAIILDDGWFGPGLDDDGPQPINHGDYEAEPSKFSDLPGLIRQVQAMDLKFLLWHAPLCVAPTSKAASELSNWFMRDAQGDYLSANGMHQLCPACPQVRAYVQQETQRLLKAFGVDGLKVDLFNCLSPLPCCSEAHEHDIKDPLVALDALMAATWAAARQVNPDVLIELKQDYGNVRLAAHGTMVRAGDTAYDIDTNLLRCGYTQAYAQCVHVDPLVTGIHAHPQAVAIMMIKALAGGVPTYSIDLTNISDELLEVFTVWTQFYNTHRAMFMTQRSLQGRAMNVWQGGDEHQSWLAVAGQANEIKLPITQGVMHLLNGTDRQTLYLQIERPVQVHLKHRDATLKLKHEQHITLTPGGQLPVIAGGLTEIHFS